jgi:hypothetical protein
VKKLFVTPKIGEAGIPGFLLWARRESPALYASMVRNLPEVADFDNVVNSEGIAGVFDSIVGALSSAAGKIGTFVKNNALPIFTAALPVAVAVKQADVAKAQVKLAEAQQPPMQTGIASQGGYSYPVPVRQSIGAGMSIPPGVLWAGGGILAVGLLALILRK